MGKRSFGLVDPKILPWVLLEMPSRPWVCASPEKLNHSFLSIRQNSPKSRVQSRNLLQNSKTLVVCEKKSKKYFQNEQKSIFDKVPNSAQNLLQNATFSIENQST